MNKFSHLVDQAASNGEDDPLEASHRAVVEPAGSRGCPVRKFFIFCFVFGYKNKTKTRQKQNKNITKTKKQNKTKTKQNKTKQTQEAAAAAAASAAAAAAAATTTTTIDASVILQQHRLSSVFVLFLLVLQQHQRI